MAGSALIWAPPGRGRPVPGARNGPFWPQKNPGACFWGRKKREWGHAIPRFSIETGLFGRRKTQGRVLGAEKKPLREWPHAIPRFSIGTDLFSRQKTQWRVFGAEKKAPAGSTRTHTLVLGKDWSRTRRGNTTRMILLDSTNFVCYTPPCLVEPSSPGFEPGASGVRRPCANPLGNLTTVGHLAKASQTRALI